MTTSRASKRKAEQSKPIPSTGTGPLPTGAGAPDRFTFHGGERSSRSPSLAGPAAFETVPARLSGSLSRCILPTMPRDLGDLSEEEWEAAQELAKTLSVGTPKEITDRTLLVRSHMWPRTNGLVDWLVFVPGTLHRARGVADDVQLGQRAINAQVEAWYPELTKPDGVDATLLIQRLRP